jgi:tetratricopeptide (TPR) repeat protein
MNNSTSAQVLKDIDHFLENVHYSKAIVLLEGIINTWDKTEDWQLYADIQNKYCCCLIGISNYAKAAAVAHEVLLICSEKLPANSLALANCYGNFGLIAYYAGKYDQAIAYIEQKISILQTIMPHQSSVEMAGCYADMGTFYYQKGKYSVASQWHIKSLKIYLTTFGYWHYDTANSYSNLGAIYFEEGQYSKATEYLNSASIIMLQVLGKNHITTAINYGNLAASYHRKGDYNNAIKYYHESLALKLQLLGNEDPRIADSYNNLGSFYIDMDNYTQALEYLFQGLSICKKVVGSRHYSIGTIYLNIGVAYNNMGDYSKAIKYYKNALKISQQYLGNYHPNIASIYSAIAVLYKRKNKYSIALQYIQLALQANCENNDDEPSSNPNNTTLSLKGQLSSQILFRNLKERAKCLLSYYQQTKAKEILYNAITVFYQSDHVLEQIRNNFLHENSKLDLGAKAAELSEDALDAIWDFKELHENRTPHSSEILIE